MNEQVETVSGWVDAVLEALAAAGIKLLPAAAMAVSSASLSADDSEVDERIL